MTTTHPYPALPLTQKELHPERYRPYTWLELFELGCPGCGVEDYFAEFSECDGIHRINIEAGWAPGLEDDDYEVHRVTATWEGHTNMEGGSVVVCRNCMLELEVDKAVLDYR